MMVSIDMSMPYSAFENDLQEQIDNWNEPMHQEIKKVSTKHGKDLYKITVENDAHTAMFEMIAEQAHANNLEEIVFKTLKLSDFNGGFSRAAYTDHSVVDTDNDPAAFMEDAMRSICMSRNGTCAMIRGTTPLLCRNGKGMNSSIGVVADSDGKVFSLRGGEDVSDVRGGPIGPSFKINKPINEWVLENQEVADAVKAMAGLSNKMDIVGKAVMQMRLKDEVDPDEFRDIFCQAGTLGFGDETLKTIYKLML